MSADQQPDVVLEQTQKIMLNRGKARVQLSNLEMLELGFPFGQPIRIDVEDGAIHVRPDENGQRVVARVKNHGKHLPTIDLKQTGRLDLSTLGEIGDQVTVRYHRNLLSILRMDSGRVRVGSDELPSRLEPEAVEKALDRIDAKGFAPHKPSHTYILVSRMKDYPPVAVMAFALEEMGRKGPVAAGQVRGEEDGPVFRLLRDAGYKITRIDDAEVLDPASDESSDEAGTEGQRRRVLGTRIERKKALRDRCLEHYGFDCQVCGFNFADEYGELGQEFIHVHHVNPLAISGETQTDPVRDLRPVCPNCHSMLHKKHPPYTLEELKARLHSS